MNNCMLYNYMIIAGFLLKIKLVFFFLCPKEVPESHWFMVNHPWDTAISCLAWFRWGWVREPLRMSYWAPLMHQLRSSGLTFLFSLTALPSCAWTLSFMQVQLYSASSHTHAMCFLSPATCPGDTVSWACTCATRSAVWTHERWHPMGVYFPFFPQNEWHFIRTKQLVTDSRGQLELVCPPLLFHPPFPSLLLHGTTWPSKSSHRSSYHWFCSPRYSD